MGVAGAHTAVVFPGQGSQSVGMLAELGGNFPVVAETFNEASNTLELDLWALTQSGPEESLNRTQNTQPAMLAAGVAVWRVWQQENGTAPSILAGHSLGEYTALVCSGSLDFATAIRLVAERGKQMQDAVPAGRGAMAAIIGLPDAAVAELCQEAAQGMVLEPANFNAPGQVVIAGERPAVERGAEKAREAGAKRAIILPLSVPSHCSLMLPAAQALSGRLDETTFRAPQYPVLHNVDVAEHNDAKGIRDALVKQLSRPVRWVETIQRMSERGVVKIIEMGPGRILSGLNRRIESKLECLWVNDPVSLQSALEAQGSGS